MEAHRALDTQLLVLTRRGEHTGPHRYPSTPRLCAHCCLQQDEGCVGTAFSTQIINLKAREEAYQSIHALKLSGLLRGGWITPGLQPAHGFPCLEQFLIPRQRVQPAAVVSQCAVGKVLASTTGERRIHCLGLLGSYWGIRSHSVLKRCPRPEHRVRTGGCGHSSRVSQSPRQPAETSQAK